MCEADSKKPYLGQEEDKRLQRVEIYLNDLKERLQKLRGQHDAIIDDSVNLIEEIDEVSASLMLGKNDTKGPCSKIRKLIEEFEQTKRVAANAQPKTEMNIAAGKNMREIMLNFERINQSNVLQDSLNLFRKAKESFVKVDSLIGQLNKIHNNVQMKKANEQIKAPRSLNFQEKLIMFDAMIKTNKSPNAGIKPEKHNNMSQSTMHLKVEGDNSIVDLEHGSTEKFVHTSEEDSEHSDEEIQKVNVYEAKKPTASSNASFKSFDNTEATQVPIFSVSGYDGDCDSEFSGLVEKKKMKEI